MEIRMWMRMRMLMLIRIQNIKKLFTRSSILGIDPFSWQLN